MGGKGHMDGGRRSLRRGYVDHKRGNSKEFDKLEVKGNSEEEERKDANRRKYGKREVTGRNCEWRRKGGKKTKEEERK